MIVCMFAACSLHVQYMFPACSLVKSASSYGVQCLTAAASHMSACARATNQAFTLPPPPAGSTIAIVDTVFKPDTSLDSINTFNSYLQGQEPAEQWTSEGFEREYGMLLYVETKASMSGSIPQCALQPCWLTTCSHCSQKLLHGLLVHAAGHVPGRGRMRGCIFGIMQAAAGIHRRRFDRPGIQILQCRQQWHGDVAPICPAGGWHGR
jgi:hypothetical protein